MSESIGAPELMKRLRNILDVEGTNSFARRTGINQATVSLCVNGHRPPTEAIANALGFIELPRRYVAAKGAK